MIILPAIDMMGGLPVRLYQGEYESAAQVADDVLKTAAVSYTHLRAHET